MSGPTQAHQRPGQRLGHRLGLGTAQFGMSYGLTSQGHAVPESEVAAILELARAASISMLDTAPAYGESEAVLGRVLTDGNGANNAFKIVTKLPSLRSASSLAGKRALARQSFERSLRRLAVPRGHGLILHDADDLGGADGEALADLLEDWRAEGLVERIGVSVYDTAQVDRALEISSVDLIQAPVNVFDQRLLDGGRLRDLEKRGVEVHARSAFLQGLLLMDETEVPPHLAHAKPHLSRYRTALTNAGVSPFAAALGFVKGIAEIDHIIIGVHSARHLAECLDAFDQPCAVEFAAHRTSDTAIIDPRLWSKAGRPSP